MVTQIKKGILELCVLFLISENDYYGYSLTQKLVPCFTGVKDSTIYSIVRRLEKSGCVEYYTTTASRRKYLRITTKGMIRKNKLINDWQELIFAVDFVLAKKIINV